MINDTVELLMKTDVTGALGARRSSLPVATAREASLIKNELGHRGNRQMLMNIVNMM